jgi:DNA anti-recombination protein RmuC
MCNIALSTPCKTDNLNCLLGWAEELQTLRKQYQGAEMRLTELQNKYRAAKKIARRYKLWADGKERHLQQEWQRIVIDFQEVLQVVQAKAQAALTDSAVPDSAVTKQLDEQIQALQDTLVQYTHS